MKKPTVLAVSCSPKHTFSKLNQASIRFIAGFGVENDAHAGKLVKHLSRVAQDPNKPNFRQVYLIQSELFDELLTKGFQVIPGQMGENITTKGIGLLNLPKNTILQIGGSAKIQITGLRSPCAQLDGIKEGLMKAVLDKDSNGEIIRKSGIMAIVIESGEIKPNDLIKVELPNEPFEKLQPV
jgi:hypothetical protein